MSNLKKLSRENGEKSFMARYCFYCGSELAQGERCQCRQSQNVANANESKKEDPVKSESKTSEKPPHDTQSAPKNTASESKVPKAKKQKVKRTFSTLSDQLRTLYPLIGQSILSSSLYLTRPSTKIRQEAVRPKRTATFFVIYIYMILTGLICSLMLGSTTTMLFRFLLSLLGYSANTWAQNSFAAFFYFCGVALLWFFILAVSFRICCAIARKKISFRRILDLLSISLNYVIFLEILILFSIRYMGHVGSLTLLISAIAIMILANYLALRNALGLSDDTTLLVTVFSYFLGATVIRLIFPSITNFVAKYL